MMTLTAAQQAVMNHLTAYRQTHGISPSIRDLQSALGLRSPSAVQFHLRNLRDMGVVTWERGRSRSLRPVSPEPISSPSGQDSSRSC